MNDPTVTPIVQSLDLCKQVSTAAGPLVILDQINLSILQGESVAIVGESGSGKSTLLGLLAGLDTPSSGRVIFEGQDLGSLDEDGRAALRAGAVGFVFQSFQLMPSLTALENIMLPLELNGDKNAEPHARSLLEKVDLTNRWHHYPRQLSGGEQQRVAIARAFSVDPKLLYADEPTGNLDRRTGQRVIDTLFALNEEHATTLVLISHDEALASRCNRLLRLDTGRLVT